MIFTSENTMYTRLKKDSQTISIMEEFYTSTKEYLILSKIFYYKDYVLSLIIKRRPQNFKFKYKEFTMSELKSCVDKDIRDEFPDRMRTLITTMLDSLRNKDIKIGQIIQFNQPIAFGGQTKINRTGFGSIYFNDMEIYEGTCYGETTDFMIVGFEVNILYCEVISGKIIKW